SWPAWGWSARSGVGPRARPAADRRPPAGPSGRGARHERPQARLVRMGAVVQGRRALEQAPVLHEPRRGAYQELARVDLLAVLDQPPRRAGRVDLVAAFQRARVVEAL